MEKLKEFSKNMQKMRAKSLDSLQTLGFLFLISGISDLILAITIKKDYLLLHGNYLINRFYTNKSFHSEG